jgi:hypothetical protein
MKMANNVILRVVHVTEAFRPLSDRPLIGTVTISAPPFNTNPVFLRAGEGEEAYLIPSEHHLLHKVDLSTLEVYGTEGDVLSIIGGTW